MTDVLRWVCIVVLAMVLGYVTAMLLLLALRWVLCWMRDRVEAMLVALDDESDAEEVDGYEYIAWLERTWQHPIHSRVSPFDRGKNHPFG